MAYRVTASAKTRSNAVKSPVVLKDGEPGVGTVERVINKSALGSASRSSHRIQISEQGLRTSITVPDTFSDLSESLAGWR